MRATGPSIAIHCCLPALFRLCAAAAAHPAPQHVTAPTRAEILRGEYSRYRANNDLVYYDLDVRVDPEKKFISGKNTVRFRMLRDDTRIQLDLFRNYTIDRIVLEKTRAEIHARLNTVYIDFPQALKAGRTYSIDFHYSGQPLRVRRFDALAFKKDPMAATGSTPPTKASARRCGGRARIRGATSPRAWTSACRSRTT
jgi:hypothetical protein